MKIYRGLNDPSMKHRKRAIAIGIFDGVHRGHRRILEKARNAAKKLKAGSMVLTFEPHPQKILFPKQAPPKFLMSLQHRLRTIAKQGITEAWVIPFNRSFASISREDFLNKLLIQKAGMKALSVGDDFRFGHKARGDRNFLSEQARLRGFDLQLTKPLKNKKDVISSTLIRLCVEKGKLSQAAKLLGRPVSIYGTVVHGRGRGASIGFPTANLNPHHETLPPAGVYAAVGILGKKRLPSVVHIGKRPTFGDQEPSVEVHFIGFRGDLYGRDVELIFKGRLRNVRKFASPARLTAQIHHDIAKAHKIFSAHH